MPGLIKAHGEVTLKDAPARVEDTVIGRSEGVRIYARTNPHGPPTLNGSHKGKGPIERIAERLHALGYAVKIERFTLGPVHNHDFEAVWAGEGEPPPLPFELACARALPIALVRTGAVLGVGALLAGGAAYAMSRRNGSRS